MEVNSGEAASQETRPRRRTAGALLRQPSPPGDSAAGTARCASRGCRQVFGLMGAKGEPSSYIRRFPRHGASVLVAGSFPITAAGQCRSGANASPASRFNPVACDHRNRRAQHSGASRRRQHEMLCGTGGVDAMRVSRAESFFSHQPNGVSCRGGGGQSLPDRVSRTSNRDPSSEGSSLAWCHDGATLNCLPPEAIRLSWPGSHRRIGSACVDPPGR